MLKRVAIALFLALFCTTLPVWASAEFYQNTVLLAVNVSEDSQAEGRFTFTPAGTAPEPEAEMLSPVPEKSGDWEELPQAYSSLQSAEENPRASYSVGDKKSILDFFRTGSETDRVVRMECLVVGEYCTVWGSVSDPEPMRIDTERAQLLASTFDANCMRTVELFGDWYDADGDGKVAIFVYDFGARYGTKEPVGYSGYFSDANLSRIDCINIEAGPTSGVYPVSHFKSSTTSIHEFQHLISASYHWRDGVSYIERFLDEGMSVAAQDVIQQRGVSPFNYLYQWGSNIYDWQDYTMNLIFVRYLRTRWAQTAAGDPEGLTVYKRIQQTRIARKDETSDSLKIIAEDLFGTTKQQLLVDFWTAIYLKELTGVHGFHGEEWANELSPKLFLPTDDTYGIRQGGAKFFLIDGKGGEVTDAQNLVFVPFETTRVTSGSCGENATWELQNGRLTIRGTGAMKDYRNHGTSDSAKWPPWDSIAWSVREIVVEEGITAIGEFAFEECKNLERVTLPDSLVKLGRQTFCGTAIREITIPDNVRIIPYECFGLCRNLERVKLPAKLTEIYPSAFYYCTSLTEMTIPAGLIAIGYWAFQDTPLKKLRFLGDAPELHETSWEIANYYVNYNCNVFEEGVTLYYIPGRKGWQSGSDYDAEKQLKYGFPIAPWDGVEEGLREGDAAVKISAVKPDYTNGVCVQASVHCPENLTASAYCMLCDSSGKMIGLEIQALEAGENTLKFDVNNGNASNAKIIVLDSKLIPQCAGKTTAIA